MKSEIPSGNEKQKAEPIREGAIDLTAVTFDFCPEEFVKDYWDKKVQELEDKEKMPLAMKQVREITPKIMDLKNDLEWRIDEIRKEVTERLSKYLPDWSPENTEIIFTINDKADFCYEGKIVTVDLRRLSFEEDPFKIVMDGLMVNIGT